MKIRELIEGREILDSVKHTLPPTYVIPELPNNDAYKQYRHLVALAAARSTKDDNRRMDAKKVWGQDQSVTCYTDADRETMELANQIMGVSAVALTTTPSSESPERNTVSPVRKFVDLAENKKA